MSNIPQGHQPKYIYGKENPNYTGPVAASDAHVSDAHDPSKINDFPRESNPPTLVQKEMHDDFKKAVILTNLSDKALDDFLTSSQHHEQRVMMQELFDDLLEDYGYDELTEYEKTAEIVDNIQQLPEDATVRKMFTQAVISEKERNIRDAAKELDDE